MNYNDLWDFAKNRNLYYGDNDGDYVIYVKKPKKKEIYKNRTRW